jgi:hypothetical protein
MRTLVTINNFQLQLINGFDNDAAAECPRAEMVDDGQWEKRKKYIYNEEVKSIKYIYLNSVVNTTSIGDECEG